MHSLKVYTVIGFLTVCSLMIAILFRTSDKVDNFPLGNIDEKVVIDFTHNEIHQGRHHFVCGFDTLASGASTTFAVKAFDNPEYVHMIYVVEASGILEIEVYEGGATTTVGTTSTPINSNRNNYATSTLMLTKNAHVAGNTLLYEQKYGAETNKTQFGGQDNRENELILRRNTLYYFKFISGTADNIVSYCGEWYETSPSD